MKALSEQDVRVLLRATNRVYDPRVREVPPLPRALRELLRMKPAQ